MCTDDSDSMADGSDSSEGCTDISEAGTRGGGGRTPVRVCTPSGSCWNVYLWSGHCSDHLEC